MRALFFLMVVIALLASGSVLARNADKWTGPGWYEVQGDPGGYYLESGPYATEAECKAILHPSTQDAEGNTTDFACYELDARPQDGDEYGVSILLP